MLEVVFCSSYCPAEKGESNYRVISVQHITKIETLVRRLIVSATASLFSCVIYRISAPETVARAYAGGEKNDL